VPGQVEVPAAGTGNVAGGSGTNVPGDPSVLGVGDAPSRAVMDDLVAARVRLMETESALMVARSSAKKARRKSTSTDLIVLLRKAFRGHVWRSIKFITSEKQRRLLCIKVLKASGLPNKFNEQGKLTSDGAEFIKDHAGTFSFILNDTRSYTQTGMKNAAFDYMTSNQTYDFPSNEEFLKILRRDQDCNRELFAWWWEDFMPKADASADHWNKETKYFGCLSTAHPPDSPGEPYITPSTEAYAMLMIMNCRDKWPKLKAIKDSSSERCIYTKKKGAKAKPGARQIDTSADQDFLGKYTRTDSGQKEFGGWTHEGLLKYKELVQLNKEGRKKATTPALEARILSLLREKNGIVGRNYEEYEELKKGRKRPMTLTAEVEGLFTDDEDEDDEEEYEDDEDVPRRVEGV